MGVPAITTRGMNEAHMATVVELIDRVLMHIDNQTEVDNVAKDVHRFMEQFPLYPELG